MKFLFVVNPVSGGKKKNDWEAAIREYFSDKPHFTEFYILQGKNDKSSIRHHIEKFRPHRVIAVGGDGTVKLLAGLVMETDMVLGILPAGSANGMARELELPADVNEAISVIEDGEIRQIDLIRVNDEICIHLSDIGLNALIVKYFHESLKKGMWGYARGIWKILWRKPKMRVVVQTGDQVLQRSAYMVVLANARKYGTGANINPDGRIDDGKFEIVIVRKLNLLEVVKALFTDRSFHPRRIEVISARQAELVVNRSSYFQVDGEYRGKVARLSANILPGALKIVAAAGNQENGTGFLTEEIKNYGQT